MIELADNEARHIAVLYRRMVKQIDRRLAPMGLGPGRYVYLFQLYLEDGRSQQALADSTSTDKAATARALLRLEADGYVRRVPDPGDRRVVRIFLTPRGKRQRGVLKRATADIIASLTEPLDIAERRQLRELLRKLVGDEKRK